jgi:phosphorylcholine metabolism protein LicD
MSAFLEKMKSVLRNRKIYQSMKTNPLLGKVNQHYKDKVTAGKRASVQKYGLESLQLLKKAFNENGREFWLDYGTLLGAVRENDFIGHDADIDIATIFKGNEAAKEIERSLINKGFTKSREFKMDGKLVEETYLYKGVNLDIFYYYQEADGKVYCFSLEEGENTIYDNHPDYTRVTGLSVKRIDSTFTGLTMIVFKGEHFPIPESFDQYLQDNYGPTYMVKDENWDWSKMGVAPLPYKDNTEAFQYKQN